MIYQNQLALSTHPDGNTASAQQFMLWTPLFLCDTTAGHSFCFHSTQYVTLIKLIVEIVFCYFLHKL